MNYDLGLALRPLARQEISWTGQLPIIDPDS